MLFDHPAIDVLREVHLTVDVAAHLARCAKCRVERRLLGLEVPTAPSTLASDRGPAANRRYELVRCIGRGSFGVVYEARARRSGQRVALKVLHDRSPQALAYFKREFRALQGVVHPNLVTLHELSGAGQHWWFVMDYVDGTDLLTWIDSASESPEQEDGDVQRSRRDSAARDARIRSAFEGLSRALLALHAAGHVHRDLKPSNILVTSTGQVVVVDFGLVASAPTASSAPCVGTPAYMAPEQAAGGRVGQAADWYAVGVMLYQALSGQLPFGGSRETQMRARLHGVPAAFRPDGATMSADLMELTMALLARDPARRAGGAQILQLVGGKPDTPERGPAPFVGRAHEVHELLRFAKRALSGTSSVALVSGPAGIGKTSLVNQLLRSVSACWPHAVVLRGCCHPHEAVSYKAVDALVDALVDWLRTQPQDLIDAVRPVALEAMEALAQIFPVTALLQPHRSEVEPGEIAAVEQRRRAFDALRELLLELARRRPLVLFLDDLHWADSDSANLLAHLLANSAESDLLVLAAFREENDNPALAQVREALRNAAQLTHIALAPLPAAKALELAQHHGATTSADAVAAMAKGNPFLVEELAWCARQQPELLPSLSEMMITRRDSLDGASWRALCACTLSGWPVSAGELAAICQLDGPATTLAKLQALRLLRTVQGGMLPYHDLVRHAVLPLIDPDTRLELHRAFSAALEPRHDEVPERLSLHFEAIGERGRAATLSAVAAEEARRELAFDRAARLFARAVELAPTDGRRILWLEARARALDDAGRPAEAGRAYGALAREARPSEQPVLERKAALCLLRAGHYEPAMVPLRPLLARSGCALPKSSVRAAMSAAHWHARLAIERWGADWKPGQSTDRLAAERARLLSEVAVPLIGIDGWPAIAFLTRSIVDGMRGGDALALSRSCMAYGMLRSTMDPLGRAPEWLWSLLDRAVPSGQDVLAATMRLVLDAWSASWQGKFAEALRLSARASTGCRRWAPGDTRMSGAAEHACLGALRWLGCWRELGVKCAEFVRTAVDRGDLFTAGTHALPHGSLGELARDQPSAAEDYLDQWDERWMSEVPTYQTGFTQLSGCLVSLYRAQPQRVAAQAARYRRAALRAGGLDVALYSLILEYSQVVAHLTMACADRFRRGRELRAAQKWLRRLSRRSHPLASELQPLLRANVAAAIGSGSEAVALLRRAEGALETRGVALYLHSARHLRGRLVGGDEGHGLVSSAEAAMRELGIVRPDRLVRLFAVSC